MIQRKLHPDCIEEVKERTDIVDLISGFVGLKKRGQEFLGLCPFHDEKTPSFSVSPTKKLAYCFGCSWGGNAIKFLMELNKVSFTDAVMDLARSTGVRIQYEDGSSDDDYPVSLPRPHQPITPVKQQEQSEPQKDYTVDERRVIASVKRLLSGEGDAAKALKWLHQRGITREIIKRYQLGLEKRVVTPNEFNPEKKETYWAIAIFIPVPNRLGRFYVKKRVAPWLSDGERPSYLGKWAQFGVPASIWFTHNPDEAQETWFCEGEWDALLLGELARQQGKKVAVACSTAGAGSLPKQEELCRLPGVVTTFFDRDDAGTKGAQKLVEALGEKGRIALVPIKDDCNQKGWDVSNALDAGYTWEDFEAAASLASSYTPSVQKNQTSGDRTIIRDEWELKHGFGLLWLQKRVKHVLSKAKGFGKKPAKERKQSAPPNIIRYPQQPLPAREDYEGYNLPRIIFKKGHRLEVLVKLKELGWKFVCDRSFTGSGKSHEAGLLYPDPNGTNKIWYFDIHHTNPSTETVEEMTNMPPRHDGMIAVKGKFTPKGNPHLRWAKDDDVPTTPSLCHNAELFIELKQKGWDADTEKSTVKDEDGKAIERNPICKGCRFAGKCHQEIGEGYGYLKARREAIEARRIRASLNSAPLPDDYRYNEDITFLEEASRSLQGSKSLSAWENEVAQLWGYVERKAPGAFVALQSLRFALQDALEGKFDRIEKGTNRGADHETLIDNLPAPSAIADLPNLIFQVKQAMPSLKDVVEEPDSVTGLGGKWRNIGQFARNTFKSQATHQTKENIEALPPNVLSDALEVWAGVKQGSLRVYGKQLQVTVPNTNHADVLKACQFVVLLDATPNTKKLEKILGAPVLEIEEERLPLTNITVVNVDMKGMGSNQISDSCKSRQLALLEWIKQQHPEVKVLANKADSHLPLDGWWFNDNRGSNAFKGVEALAAFNTPRPNLGVIQDEYRALFGSLEGFEEYYQELIQSEIVQLIGRPRAHQYPEKQFTLYLTTTNQDLSYLTDLGCQVDSKEAFELTPLAGTSDQITRWKILQAVGQLQGQKLTQEAIASLIGKSQELVSKIAKEFGGWKTLKKILLALLGVYRDGNNFHSLTKHEKWQAETYLPGLLDKPPEDAVQGISKVIQVYGLRPFLRVLTAATPQTQVRLLTLVMQALPVSLQSELIVLVEGSG
jgi:hypothetical protein